LLSRLLIIALVSAIAGNASAQEPGAKAQLAEMQANVAELTSQRPAIGNVRVFLAGECRKAFSSLAEPNQTAFCQCGSTVTLTMWLTSDEMLKILTDYVSTPTDAKLSDLAKYQGPELYKPFCTEAVGA
jgi:hypothetical protein